jgi:hypothetical protein
VSSSAVSGGSQEGKLLALLGNISEDLGQSRSLNITPVDSGELSGSFSSNVSAGDGSGGRASLLVNPGDDGVGSATTGVVLTGAASKSNLLTRLCQDYNKKLT